MTHPSPDPGHDWPQPPHHTRPVPATPQFVLLSARSAADLPRVVGPVIAGMAAQGFPEEDVFAVRLALEEAVINGVKHGNRGDPSKHVQVRCHLTPESILVEVEDEGDGFNPESVPDPRDPENLERPSGRGLLLMRHYLTEVRYHGRGNRVTLCKRRSDG